MRHTARPAAHCVEPLGQRLRQPRSGSPDNNRTRQLGGDKSFKVTIRDLKVQVTVRSFLRFVRIFAFVLGTKEETCLNAVYCTIYPCLHDGVLLPNRRGDQIYCIPGVPSSSLDVCVLACRRNQQPVVFLSASQHSSLWRIFQILPPR